MEFHFQISSDNGRGSWYRKFKWGMFALSNFQTDFWCREA